MSTTLTAAQEREQKKKKEAEERKLLREQERLESLIEDLEKEIPGLEEEMCLPETLGNVSRLKELGGLLEAKKKELEETYILWEDLSKKILH